MTRESTDYRIAIVEKKLLTSTKFAASNETKEPIHVTRAKVASSKWEEITSFFCFSNISTCKLEKIVGY